MFPLRSHLDFPHVASGTSHLTTASQSARSSDLAGIGADVATSVPAPIATTSDLLKRALLIGGIALVVYLVMRQMQKQSK